MWLTMAIIAGAVFFYAWEKVSLELTSLTVVAIFLVLFHFMPVDMEGAPLSTKALLAGFADPALISILALLVIGQALVQTGALEPPVRFLLQYGGNYPIIVIFLCLVVVMVVSAFMNNTPVVVIFIPIMTVLAERLGHAPSKVMIPLSFAAILGGMTTLIGSSTNLLVAGAVERVEGLALDFFSITEPGVFLAFIGLIYVFFLAPRLLPDRKSLLGDFHVSSGKQFIVQIEVTKDSVLEGKQAIAGMFPDLANMTVRLVQRGEQIFLPPFENVTLQAGDAVTVATTRKSLMEALSANPHLLEGVIEEGSNEETVDEELRKAGDRLLAEVMIAPASRLDGRTLDQTGFRQTSGCAVLGIQRRSRMIRAGLNDIRLEAGDILLLLGKRRNIQNLRASRDVLLLEWSAADLPERTHAGMAAGIFLAVVAAAASGLVPIPVAATVGVAAMIITGCLNVRQASRAVDRRIFMLVGAALAMGTALEYTGGAAYLAHNLLDALEGTSNSVVISAFFLLVALMTNILSNNATAVLFTPIAINLARETGIDPMVYVSTVIFAANCSFATPMGYQTNLLVMGPGHYKFADFMRVGIPLILLIWLAFTLFAPWYYGL
ncbi:MAG: SLC13 family permease [Alphaproteobacteria bacterium]|nr:MAG: SLC13 family permease [Alphaproteobacteria bacterium]